MECFLCTEKYDSNYKNAICMDCGFSCCSNCYTQVKKNDDRCGQCRSTNFGLIGSGEFKKNPTYQLNDKIKHLIERYICCCCGKMDLLETVLEDVHKIGVGESYDYDDFIDLTTTSGFYSTECNECGEEKYICNQCGLHCSSCGDIFHYKEEYSEDVDHVSFMKRINLWFHLTAWMGDYEQIKRISHKIKDSNDMVLSKCYNCSSSSILTRDGLFRQFEFDKNISDDDFERALLQGHKQLFRDHFF